MQDYDPVDDGTRRRQLSLGDLMVILNLTPTFSEGYRAMMDQYIRDSDAYALLYDVTNRGSFNQLEAFHEEVQNFLHSSPVPLLGEQFTKKSQEQSFIAKLARQLLGKRPAAHVVHMATEIQTPSQSIQPVLIEAKVQKPYIVIATKTDLVRTSWVVTPEEGKQFSERIGAPFCEVSAKTGAGCGEEIMHETARIAAQMVITKRKSHTAGSRRGDPEHWGPRRNIRRSTQKVGPWGMFEGFGRGVWKRSCR